MGMRYNSNVKLQPNRQYVFLMIGPGFHDHETDQRVQYIRCTATQFHAWVTLRKMLGKLDGMDTAYVRISGIAYAYWEADDEEFSDWMSSHEPAKFGAIVRVRNYRELIVDLTD